MTSLARAGSRPWRLGARTRKGVLVIHIGSAGTWIGMEVVLAVIVFTALLTDYDRTKAVGFQALELFAVWPLLTVGLTCLGSGVVLGLGTRYGLLRYWWVTIKLALSILLTMLVVVSLRVGVSEVAEQGRLLAAGAPATIRESDLLGPAIVAPTTLLFAVVLAVFKPWGRIRNRGPAASPPGEREAT